MGSPALAVTSVEHGTWRGTETRVAAISATTGEYVVLNIPANTTDDDEVVLSPDGRYLAYWTAGTPTGDPNTSDGQEDPTTGVTVYGLVTGKQVAHHEIASEHGVIPTSLLWADATTLVFGYGQWAEGDTGDNPGLAWQKDDRAFTWSLGDTPERLQLPGVSGIDSTFSEAQDGVVLTGSRLIDLNRNTSQKIRVPASPGNTGPGGGSGDLRGDGVYTTIGGPGLPPQTPNKVTLTKIGSSGSTTKPRVVPGTSGTIQVLGWRSDRLVLTRWLRGDRAEIQAVDVETGEHEVLARTPRRGSGSLWQWAEDLLEAEVVPGREPPSPVDPRLLLGWIVAVIAATGTALVYWRRRVRA